MKHYGAFKALHPFAALVLSACLAASPTFANSVIAGGFVPEKRYVKVTALSAEGGARPDGSVAIAILELDINLPSYGLVLDFADASGAAAVTEVSLEPLDGILGRGLPAPGGERLRKGAAEGSFVWSPGPQRSATVNYRMLVVARFGGGHAMRPDLTIAMDASY